MSALEEAADDVGEAVGEEDTEIPPMVFAEMMYRRGIVDNFDMGLKLTLPGTIALDGKYQFLKKGDFAMSSGLSLGYLSMGEGEEKTTVIDTIIPVNMGYDVNNWFSLYASPKYLLRMSGGESASIVGSSAGLRLGKGFGLYLEGTYAMALDGSTNITQMNAALAFGPKDKKKKKNKK